MKGRKAVSCDREAEDGKVGSEGEGDGRERRGTVLKEDDGPKRGDREYRDQNRLWGLGLVPVEGVVGEL